MAIYSIKEARFKVMITDQINFHELRHSSYISVSAIYGEVNENRYLRGREYTFCSTDFIEQEKEIALEIISMKQGIIKDINRDLDNGMELRLKIKRR